MGYQVRKYLTENRVLTSYRSELWDMPNMDHPDLLWATVEDTSDGMLVQVWRRIDSGAFVQVDLTAII